MDGQDSEHKKTGRVSEDSLSVFAQEILQNFPIQTVPSRLIDGYIKSKKSFYVWN